MDSKQFDAIVEDRIRVIRETLAKKRAEYAPEGGDRLHNFKRMAEMQRCTPERALVGAWSKHLISILDICDNCDKKEYPQALVEEKITDGITYLLLLEGMLAERRERFFTMYYKELKKVGGEKESGVDFLRNIQIAKNRKMEIETAKLIRKYNRGIMRTSGLRKAMRSVVKKGKPKIPNTIYLKLDKKTRGKKSICIPMKTKL